MSRRGRSHTAEPVRHTMVSNAVAAALLVAVVMTATIPGVTGTTTTDYQTNSNANIQVYGMGDAAAGPLFQVLTKSYPYVRDNVEVEYKVTDSLTAIENAFVTDYSVFTRAIPEEATILYKITQFPVVAKTLVMACNVPELAGLAPLVIDRPTLAAIWLGNVTRWNSPAIAALNQGLAAHLPNRTIVVGYTVDSSLSTTVIIGNSLASFSPSFAAAWDVRFVYGSDANLSFVEPGVDGGATQQVSSLSTDRLDWLESTPYGLTYVDFADYTDRYGANANGTSAVRYLPMINRAGALVQPSFESVQSAMSDFRDAYAQDRLTIEVVDPPGEASWPLPLVVFIALGDDQQRYCQRILEVLRFIAWAITNEGASATAVSLGAVPLAADLKGRVLDRLRTLRCNGRQAYSASFLIGYGPELPIALTWLDLWSTSVTTGKYYDGLSSDGGLALLETYDGDFGLTVTGAAGSYFGGMADLALMPLGTFGLAPLYNIAAFQGAPSSMAFDAETMALVYLGNVTHWDDPRIAATNPALAANLTHDPIALVVEEQPSDYNLILTGFLSREVPAFAAAVGATRSPDFGRFFLAPGTGANGSLIRASASFGVGALVDSTPYSFSLWPPFGIGLTTRVSTAAVGDYAYRAVVGGARRAVSHAIVSLNATTLAAAATLHVTTAAASAREAIAMTPPLVASAAEGAWPIGAFLSLVYRDATLPQLSKAQALADLIYWTQTATDAGTAADTESIVVSSRVPALNPVVYGMLGTFAANGTPASAVAGCIDPVTGFLCSDNGTCSSSTGRCVCDAGRTGAYCQAAEGSSGGDTALVVGLAVGLPVAAVLALLLVAVLALLAAAVRLGWMRSELDETWKIEFDDLDVGPLVGTGGYGEVYKAVWRGTEVAVKVIKADEVNGNAHRSFYEEVRVMTALRHPNVVLFMAACTRPPKLCIVMEYMALGSLYDLLHNELVPDLPTLLIYKMAYQAAKGMHFLHSSGIVHRDLKSLNLLLDAKWNVKVSDFGLTKFKEDLAKEKDGAGAGGGTIYWTAPEVLAEVADVDHALADVYSFGVIMWELATRRQPYEGMSPAAVAVAVLRDKRRPDVSGPLNCDDDFRATMHECWHDDPTIRPMFLELLSRFQCHIDTTKDEPSAYGHTASSSSSSSGSSPGAFRITGGGGGGYRAKRARYATASSSRSDPARSHSSDSHSGRTAVPRLARPGAPSPPDATDRRICFVVTDIAGADSLWNDVPKDMCEDTLLHNELLRRLMARARGFEADFGQARCAPGEGCFLVAFESASDALAWCTAVQQDLLKVAWSDAVLQHREGAVELGLEDQELYRGPRVRMAVHCGTARTRIDLLTGRPSYSGPTVDGAVRLASAAAGGQVLVTATLRDRLAGKGRPVAEDGSDDDDDSGRVGNDDKVEESDSRSHGTASFALAPTRIPWDNDNDDCYELRIPGLEGRFFGGRPLGGGPSGSDDDDDEGRGKGHAHKAGCSTVLETGGVRLNTANMCRFVINYDEVSVGDKVGEGSYGIVYRGRWKGVDVAVKKLAKQRMDEKDRLRLRAEAATMADLRHPNIVLMVGVCVAQPNVCLLTEFMPGGNLCDLLRDRGARMTLDRRAALLVSAARGIEYLHGLAPPVIHRDIKPSNLLLDDHHGNVKVADFGFARIKEENATMTRCGSPAWTAPEVFRGERYTEKVDVYSFGVVMWQALTRRKPFAGINFCAISLDVLAGKRPDMPADCPADLRSLIEACWHDDPVRRPTITEVRSSLEAFVGRRADASI